LIHSTFAVGYPGQSWLTFRQALSLDACDRKGDRGTTVVYADRFVPDDEKRRAREAGEDAQAIPLLKRFTVFNTAQCEGLCDEVAAQAQPPAPGSLSPGWKRLSKRPGSTFGSAAIDIVPTVRHADYVGSWLEVLREDSRAIVRAARQASKAADTCSLPTLARCARRRAISSSLTFHGLEK